MIAPRHPKGARAMGDFVANEYGHAARCERRCARCGCRLRHSNMDTLCAPCTTIVRPWVMPTIKLRHHDECPTCGGLKKRVSKQCRQCSMTQRFPLHTPHVRVDFTGHKPL